MIHPLISWIDRLWKDRLPRGAPPAPGPGPEAPGRPGELVGGPEVPLPGGNPPVEQVVAYITARSRRVGLPERIGLAIAWTESEMRHFAESGEPLRHINRNARGEATSSDWGMMQINDRIWGSRFDMDRLKRDWRYNVDAGLDIARGVYHRALDVSEPDPAAATYSGYNGGYHRMDRYRRRRDLRDRRFRQIYENRPWEARRG